MDTPSPRWHCAVFLRDTGCLADQGYPVLTVPSSERGRPQEHPAPAAGRLNSEWHQTQELLMETTAGRQAGSQANVLMLVSTAAAVQQPYRQQQWLSAAVLNALLAC